ncbi:MAG: GMC family oxidoreductase [Acidimicrobiia bacterium]|nr:GMC family oxidoreductase [Acidimicrobiia bacterium]
MRKGGRFDVIVIGSGFGGSVSALRLTERGYRVAVMESGRRFSTGDYARTSWNLRRFLWAPHLGLRGIQRIDLLKQVMVLSGAGVGGGSLVYANTLLGPTDDFFSDPQWGHITDWKSELGPHYERARRMLGSTPAPFDTPADDVMSAVAHHFGLEQGISPTDVAVYFGRPGRQDPDPYFGGAGPDRTGCIECGGCMVGCRYDAKNTLDRNYLYLAEKGGAQVFPEHMVTDVEKIDGGYRVTTERPGSWVRRRRRRFETTQVVFAAGALGTTKLLLRLQHAGRLPGISGRLGYLVRTNSESILGSVARDTGIDYSRGVAITSWIETDRHTRMEPVRYPAGSNVMGMLASILVKGDGRMPQWVRFLGAAALHPIRFVRSLSVRRWAERSVILLVMQSLDNSLRLKVQEGRLRSRITSVPGHGEPNPTWLPEGHEAARTAAKAMGGYPSASLNETLLGIPITAHILGGASLADRPGRGVVDPYHRVFGQPGLHVVDGAAVGANLGANPSLTITAMAERAMSMWPNNGEDDPRPPLGDPYRPVDLVVPSQPVVPEGAPGSYL